MAESLVASLAGRFEPDSYTDAYRGALEDLIERKMRGETRKASRRKPEPKVIDLMEALQASVAEARKGGNGKASTKRKGAAKKTKSRAKRRAA